MYLTNMYFQNKEQKFLPKLLGLTRYVKDTSHRAGITGTDQIARMHTFFFLSFGSHTTLIINSGTDMAEQQHRNISN